MQVAQVTTGGGASPFRLARTPYPGSHTLIVEKDSAGLPFLSRERRSETGL